MQSNTGYMSGKVEPPGYYLERSFMEDREQFTIPSDYSKMCNHVILFNLRASINLISQILEQVNCTIR